MTSLLNAASRMEAARWTAVVLIPAGMGWAAAGAGCAPPVPAFCVVTAAALVLWISGALPAGLVAVLTPVAYILGGVGPAPDILSVWSSPIGWLVLGGLAIGEMMSRTGLARRLALGSLRLCGASLGRLLWGVLLAGFAVAPFVPTAMGKATLFAIILTGVCRTLNLRPGGREASCLFLAGLLAVTVPKFVFLTASVDSALMAELARQNGLDLTWFGYLRANALPGLLYAAGSVALLRLLLRPSATGDLRAFVEREYRTLGPLDAAEIKGLAVLALLAAAMMTDSLHGVDIGWIMAATAGACFLPGLRLLDADAFGRLPLDVVFYVVGSMSIGAGAHAAGIDATLAGTMTSLLGTGEGPGVFATVYGAGTGLLMSLTSLPAVSTLTPALTAFGLAWGGAGRALPYAFLYGLDQVLMPYAYGPALLFFATGHIRLRFYVLFQGVKFLATALFIMAVAWPFWRLTM